MLAWNCFAVIISVEVDLRSVCNSSFRQQALIGIVKLTTGRVNDL